MNLEKKLLRLNQVLIPLPEDRGPIANWLYGGARGIITPAGKAMFVLLIASGVTGATIGVNYAMFVVPIFFLCLITVGRVTQLLFNPKVIVTRKLPERAACGATVVIEAQMNNRGFMPVFDVAPGEVIPHSAIELVMPPSYIGGIEKRTKAQGEYSLILHKRGVYDFTGPTSMTSFPFGLYLHSQFSPSPHRMIVYPKFFPLREVSIPVGRKHQPGGLQLVSNVGDSEEFIGNREYRAGDRIRDIDYRAWARHGKPVVREYGEEYLCRIAMVVDTFVPSGADEDDLEAALSLGASIADALSRLEYIIDIFAAGPDLYQFQAGRSLAYLDNILDILACIEPCRENPFITLGPAIMEEISQISSAVLIFLDWDEKREQFVEVFKNAGVAVKVIIVRKTEPSFETAGITTAAGPIKVLTPDAVRKGIDSL